MSLLPNAVSCRIFHALHRGVTAAARWYWRRRIHLGQDTELSFFAHVKNGGNVFIGNKTRVHADAVLDCSQWPFAYESNPCSTNLGRIVIGDQTDIRPHVLLYTYGGEIQIGNGCTINPFTVIYGHGGVSIGNDVHIAAHTVIVASDHVFTDPARPISEQGEKRLGVKIEDDVWIAAGVRILDGVRIGRGAVIAAGAVVTEDVEAGQVVGGVPARVLKMRESGRKHTRLETAGTGFAG